MKQQVTVWYDGACPLCRREIALMRRFDRRNAIDFTDISDELPNDCPVGRRELLDRLHASENGELLSGAAAFAAMWRAIPLLRPLGLVARNRIVFDVLERVYLVFLRYRPKLQQWATRSQ